MLGWGFLFKLLIWILIIAVVGITIFFIYKIYNEYNTLVSKNKRRRRKITSLQRDLAKKKRDNRSLRDKFSEQQKVINTLKTQLNSERTKQDNNEKNSHSSFISKDNQVNKSKNKTDTEKQSKSKQSLFFTVPNSDGEFDDKMASSDPKGRNYYKITFDEASNEGKIEFRSGELDASALDHRDSILRPVCEIKNSTAANPSKIENIAPGKVKRVGDKWVIEEKVKIKFQ